MKRDDIIEELKSYFAVKELVCPHTYKKFGEQSWQFLDTYYLWCLLVIRRDILKVPMTCNDSKNFTQRGLRCNMCELVKGKTSAYLSGHVLGKAGDFSSSKMSAEDMRERIKENADLLPCKIRMEKDVTWLHFDVIPQFNNENKIFEFKG